MEILTLDEHPVEGGHVEEVGEDPACAVDLLRQRHLESSDI